MGQIILYCRQCGNRLYPPAGVASVPCPACGAENRLRSVGTVDPFAAVTQPQTASPALSAGLQQVEAAGSASASALPSQVPDFRESNPFADSDAHVLPTADGAPALNFNPYATPAAVLAPPTDDFLPASARVGLPWQHSTSVRNWFATMVRIAFTPTIAFRQMKVDGEYNEVLSFSVYGALGGWAILMSGIALLMLLSLAARNGDAAQFGQQIGFVLGTLLGQLLCGSIPIAIGAAVGVLLWAAFFHAGLALLGANRHGYITTLQVVAFAHGAMLLALPLMMVPFINMMPWIWSMVVLVIGLREAQQTTTTKAILSVVMPMVAVGLAMTALVMYRFGLGPFAVPIR